MALAFVCLGSATQAQGHVIVRDNLLFFHVDWGWVSFFCYAPSGA